MNHKRTTRLRDRHRESPVGVQDTRPGCDDEDALDMDVETRTPESRVVDFSPNNDVFGPNNPDADLPKPFMM